MTVHSTAPDAVPSAPAPTARDRFSRRDLGYQLVVAEAVLLGLAVRLALVLSSGFPLNDGGLFYAMVRDLQHAGYALPTHTSYNLAGIPFAYPPLGLYLAALLDDLGPWTLVDILRFLPLVVNTLGIAAFFFLARAMLPSKVAVTFAVFVFALLPGGYEWQIMGGGLTRSVGALFAILALHQSYLMYTPLLGYTRFQHSPMPRAFSTPFSTFSEAVLGN